MIKIRNYDHAKTPYSVFWILFWCGWGSNPKVSCSFKGTLKYLAIDYWKAKELKNIKNCYKGYNSYKY